MHRDADDRSLASSRTLQTAGWDAGGLQADFDRQWPFCAEPVSHSIYAGLDPRRAIRDCQPFTP